jgi:hypothetical protein
VKLGLFNQGLTKINGIQITSLARVTTSAIADQPTYAQGKVSNPHQKG